MRNLDDCKRAIAAGPPFLPASSIRITKEWFSADKGVIPDPRSDDEILGTHAVTLAGYDDRTERIIFANPWGQEWGENGIGTLSYNHFEERSVETWIRFPGSETWKLAEKLRRPSVQHATPTPDVHELQWGMRDILRGEVVHVREFYDSDDDERIGWAFAVPRDGFLDVEELFVRRVTANAASRPGFASVCTSCRIHWACR